MLKWSTIFALLVSNAIVVRADIDPNVACYDNSGDLVSYGYNTYQTQGACHDTCLGVGRAVWATTQGSYCWCGDAFPANGEVDYVQNCNTKCNAWPTTKCGGANAWTFGVTGLMDNVPNDNIGSPNSVSSAVSAVPDSETTRAPSATASTQAQFVTITSGQTYYVTASTKSVATSSSSMSSLANSQSSGSGGSNKVPLAAGIVVGLIIAIAIGVGLWLLWRRRKRIAAEEEYRNAISNKEFVQSITANKPMQDTRLDPVMLQQRRLSDGSIADNQDFSRRILKVANPDQ